MRRLFNNCQKDKNLHIWELYIYIYIYIEWLSRDIERKYKRLPKRLGGLSLVPLTTYPGQLGYTGLYQGTLRSGWDL